MVSILTIAPIPLETLFRRKTVAISTEMTELCYEAAKSIFPNKDKINEAVKKIGKGSSMNLGSAKDYIKSFFFMMSGERMEHAMSERDTRYYFERIQNDFGDETLKKAILALQLYLAYDKQNHPSLQKLINEFDEKIKK